MAIIKVLVYRDVASSNRCSKLLSKLLLTRSWSNIDQSQTVLDPFLKFSQRDLLISLPLPLEYISWEFLDQVQILSS